MAQEPKDGFAKAGVLGVSAVVCAAQGFWALAGLSAAGGAFLAGWVLWARRTS